MRWVVGHLVAHDVLRGCCWCWLCCAAPRCACPPVAQMFRLVSCIEDKVLPSHYGAIPIACPAHPCARCRDSLGVLLALSHGRFLGVCSRLMAACMCALAGSHMTGKSALHTHRAVLAPVSMCLYLCFLDLRRSSSPLVILYRFSCSDVAPASTPFLHRPRLALRRSSPLLRRQRFLGLLAIPPPWLLR